MDLKTATDYDFMKLWKEAWDSGVEATKNASIEMIQVRDNMSGKVYDPFPICGFAWINVKPGTSRFARWLKKMNLGQVDTYYGGITVWIHDYNQSYDLKLTHARAMAKILKNHSIKCYAMGRLD